MSEERVQKALARMGVASRREVERLLEQGKIKINGSVAQPGAHVKVGDQVQMETRRVVIREAKKRIRVLMYNKPEGEVVTRQDEKGRPTVFDSLPKIIGGRWINIGRLDINTGGLILFTNHGELANRLMHPSYEVDREYAVRVLGEVSNDTLAKLRRGVMLEDGKARFEDIVDSGGEGKNHWYHVVLKEGRNREVRRLWEAVGMTVSRLIRVRFGTVVLPRNLKRGKAKELDFEELKQLMQLVSLSIEPLDDEGIKSSKKKTAFATHRKKLRHKKSPAKKSFRGR